MMNGTYRSPSRRSAGFGLVTTSVLMGGLIGLANRHSPAHAAIEVVLVFSGIAAVLTVPVFLTMRSQGAGEIVWSRLPVFYGALVLWTVACCLVALLARSL